MAVVDAPASVKLSGEAVVVVNIIVCPAAAALVIVTEADLKTSEKTNEPLTVPLWSNLLIIPDCRVIVPPIVPVVIVIAKIFVLASASAIVPCNVIVSASTLLTISFVEAPIVNP